MHRDVVGLVTLDFILWLILACMMRVPLVINIFCMHPDDSSADVSSFRVPGHVIANLELARNDGSPLMDNHPMNLIKSALAWLSQGTQPRIQRYLLGSSRFLVQLRRSSPGLAPALGLSPLKQDLFSLGFLSIESTWFGMR
jgi:hypothetical protein